MARVQVAILIAAAAGIALSQSKPAAAPPPMLGDVSAGSRAKSAHVINLRDPNGDLVLPGEKVPTPFSVSQTCGNTCHDVSKIATGWHFNFSESKAPAGREGQPWVLVDPEIGAQVPLSFRQWKGTYRPKQLGIGDFDFARRFGGRTSGGISGDSTRWHVSGALDVNCLACHDMNPAYDQAEYARQVSLENFRFAGAAASGLASVTGSSKKMPDYFSYLMPFAVEDALQPDAPRTHYDETRFTQNQKIAFDVPREVTSNRCYYCHTNVDVQDTGAARWKAGSDVHLARGITCVQCHPNGLDHQTIRGYEGEPAAAKDAFAASLSCKGCHLGDGSAVGQAHAAGPRPKHAGIPPLHFDKLTCTACHSGPWPEDASRQMKNGATHGLGEHNANKSPEALPHIIYPVFAQNQEGKLAPYRVIWPAFWGRLRGGSVEPISVDEVKRVLGRSKLLLTADVTGGWVKSGNTWLAQALSALQAESGRDTVVYIAGGKLRRLVSGEVRAEDNAQAAPYFWPLAHDVRPKAQSLGAKGCEDCHSANAPILFGKVSVDSPLGPEQAWQMNRFQPKIDAAYQSRLADSWKYRPWLKVIGLACAALIGLICLGFFFKGLDRLTGKLAGR